MIVITARTGPRVLTVDCGGTPIDFATWQDDLAANHPYYVRCLGWWFRYCDPDKKEECVQEAVVQIAVIMESEYRLHGGRTQYRNQLARLVAMRVKHGRSSTRDRGARGDLLADSRRTTGAKRDPQPLYSVRGPIDTKTPAPRFAAALSDWIATLPPRLGAVARLAVLGHGNREIGERIGANRRTVWGYREQLRNAWIQLDAND